MITYCMQLYNMRLADAYYDSNNKNTFRSSVGNDMHVSGARYGVTDKTEASPRKKKHRRENASTIAFIIENENLCIVRFVGYLDLDREWELFMGWI